MVHHCLIQEIAAVAVTARVKPAHSRDPNLRAALRCAAPSDRGDACCRPVRWPGRRAVGRSFRVDLDGIAKPPGPNPLAFLPFCVLFPLAG